MENYRSRVWLTVARIYVERVAHDVLVRIIVAVILNHIFM
jgi:hypothetical protein